MPSMRLVIAAATLGLLGGQSASAAPLLNAEDLAVDLGYGVYRGAHNFTTQLNVWKGIRYAAPPTGDLRFRAPAVPVVAGDGTVNATTFAPQCPQALPAPFPGAQSSPSGNEDCLFLNVYAPNSEAVRKLPVLVWIHGGGYGAGNGQQDMSEIINANNNGFVAVAIQYRLGAFGFLSSADIEENGALNAGILDMAFALQWVQDHIGRFGGDASRVTISGESAGGGGVMLLIIAKNGTLGNSLFSGVVAASPYHPPQYDYDASAPTYKYESFASRAGCANSTDTLACLRSKDSVTLQTANSEENTASLYGNWAFPPVTESDSGFITTLPSDSLTAKRVNGGHILVGNNANEGAPFVPSTINSTSALRIWLQGAYPNLDSTEFDAILAAYPASDDTDLEKFATNGLGSVTAHDVSQLATGPQQCAFNIYAEATFVCPSYWLSSAFTGNNRISYHYQYSVPAASHGSDVSAYFGPAKPNQPPYFTSVFRQIWGRFIEAAEPNSAQGLGNLAWPEWADDGEIRMLNLNTTGGVPFQGLQLGIGVNATQFMEPGIQNDFSVVDAVTWEGGRGERCEFWRSIASRAPI
ncbi:alpha/beta-hydrolase [Didymella exigua CBS 183.55]|uniref:Carboxylic ester hydrolase n=1 Tax=Didymella exigua CBS 183.55 TaxID=1150837 RepID=A0A6A5RGJ3_9PLEO|nr:alpha/beta-hydrolase [Didymella exigua CBS 183.55]KAF1926629.1 alpha/beta-hydrolase [Didymella exigua CBS 183.55]